MEAPPLESAAGAVGGISFFSETEALISLQTVEM